MKFLILTACVAVATAFTPATKPVCNADNNEGGSLLMSHESYCQLYYSCNGDQQAFEMTCPDGYLFSWDEGLANCIPPDGVTVTCPNWRCLSSDIGNRFPDTCCSKYWECTSGGRYEQRSCSNGQTFNSVSEACDTSPCTSNRYCIDNILPSSETHCHDVAEANSPCTYSTVWAGVTTPNRPCPYGTRFDTTTCSCSQIDPACRNGQLTAELLASNKAINVACQVSRRVDFTQLPLVTFSEKINSQLGHFFLTPGVTVQNNEAVFTNGNSGTYIYDYFFNDNILTAPLAITMTVRFTSAPLLNTEYVLLNNEFSLDPNNPLCDPATISIRARYDNIINGARSWTFQMSATGELNNVAQGSATITGDLTDYFRIEYRFSGTLSGTITNRGINANQNVRSVSITSSTNIGGAIKPNKCGFMIGRGLTGRIRNFNIYEGCGNFANIGV